MRHCDTATVARHAHALSAMQTIGTILALCIAYELHMGLFKIMVLQNCPYAALLRPFRAPAESGHGIVIMFRCVSFVQIVVSRPFANLSLPFPGLSPLEKKHTSINICKCHSHTKVFHGCKKDSHIPMHCVCITYCIALHDISWGPDMSRRQ